MPTIATVASATGTNPPGLGLTNLVDTATLSGFVGSVSGETITFHLYGPFGANDTRVCDAGHLIAAATTTGNLNAATPAVATTSQSYTPTAAGTYVWTASYLGDTLNDPIAEPCNGANEDYTVVGAQVDVAKSANPAGPVTAGSTIGFDITVTNDGSVPALGVHV